jgi:hypothetical protein
MIDMARTVRLGDRSGTLAQRSDAYDLAMSPVTTCRICGREIDVRHELGWATVHVREVVRLSPIEFVPQEFLVHVECAETRPILQHEST